MLTTFKDNILPFFWTEHSFCFSVCLNAGGYKSEIFEIRKDEGFEGNGYDWNSLAKVFLLSKLPELETIINFDSEAGMFVAYSSDEGALKNFATGFKAACEDKVVIQELFSKAELN